MIERHGTRGAPLVVLLHGACLNRKSWLPLVRYLPDFELLALDLPGHGARRAEPFSLQGALDTVGALLRSQRPRRVILAGDSLGGYVALVAAAHSERGIAGVVAGGCTFEMVGAGALLARMSDAPLALARRLVGEARLDRRLERFLPRIFDAATAREVQAAGVRVAARSESLRELIGLALTPLVERIRVPIVFVNGRYDWFVRCGERTLLAQALRGSRRIAWRVGHGVSVLAPEVFADAIRSLPEAQRAAAREAV